MGHTHGVGMDEMRELGIVVRREHRKRGREIDYLLRKGELVPVLPAIYRWADVDEDFSLRVLAVQKWQVNGIFYGSTAARLTWWPELKDDRICVAAARNGVTLPWLELARLKIDDDLLLTTGDWRVVTPECSILQMSAKGHGRAVAEGLRREVATLESLRLTLSVLPSRLPGREAMTRVLEEARDEPWSTLELDAHKLLREAGITGWRTNVRIVLPNGKMYFADVLLRRERIILELDGRQFHSHAELDEDSERRNDLVSVGWRVFNFSGVTLDSMIPTVEPVVREARRAWESGELPLLPLDSTEVSSDDVEAA